jgi:outer membrane biosynthesis protein TonB
VPNNTVRTVLIFGVIGLVLTGITVGGVQLLKARNNSYAASQSQPQPKPAQSTPEQTKQEVAKTDAQKKSGTSKSNASSGDQAQPQKSQPAAQKPAVASPSATPTPAQQPQNNSVAATGPSSLAATGPSDINFAASTILMMSAIFFGARVVQARGLIRKHLS